VKPCPCCESDNVDIIIGGSPKHRRWRVFCRTCQIRTGPEKTRKQAIAVWDQRPTPAPRESQTGSHEDQPATDSHSELSGFDPYLQTR